MKINQDLNFLHPPPPENEINTYILIKLITAWIFWKYQLMHNYNNVMKENNGLNLKEWQYFILDIVWINLQLSFRDTVSVQFCQIPTLTLSRLFDVWDWLYFLCLKYM